MADDFRLTVEFEDESRILPFGRLLAERELEKDLRERLGDGVIVTRDGPRVLLYTGTRPQAHAAERVAREALAEQDATATVSAIHRWHSVEERWEVLSEGLPPTGEQAEATHRRLEQRETEQAQAAGLAEWEVRVDLSRHAEAVEFAERLEAEGISPIVRRWKYVLIGTATEEAARELAERLRREAPAGAGVRAEASAAVGWELTSRNPFAMFGGFGPGP